MQRGQKDIYKRERKGRSKLTQKRKQNKKTKKRKKKSGLVLVVDEQSLLLVLHDTMEERVSLYVAVERERGKKPHLNLSCY